MLINNQETPIVDLANDNLTFEQMQELLNSNNYTDARQLRNNYRQELLKAANDYNAFNQELNAINNLKSEQDFKQYNINKIIEKNKQIDDMLQNINDLSKRQKRLIKRRELKKQKKSKNQQSAPQLTEYEEITTVNGEPFDPFYKQIRITPVQESDYIIEVPKKPV